MALLAHIGKIPIEEWLPFVVPVAMLVVFVRSRERRRRQALARLLDTGVPLDAATIDAVLASWSASDHGEVSLEHLPLLYPPGPDGATAAELAARTHREQATVARQLEDLAALGYVELDAGKETEETRVWLTPEGCELVNTTEDTLLAASAGD